MHCQGRQLMHLLEEVYLLRHQPKVLLLSEELLCRRVRRRAGHDVPLQRLPARQGCRSSGEVLHADLQLLVKQAGVSDTSLSISACAAAHPEACPSLQFRLLHMEACHI